MSSSYSIVSSVIKDRRFAWLKNRPNCIGQPWKLTEGVSVKEDFPSGAEFPIDPKWGDMLPDIVPNILNLLVLSSTLRNILDGEGVGDVEYLPITILDKKGRIKSEDYFVANLLGSVDCLDASKSEYKVDPLDEKQITSIKRLNVQEHRIPTEKKLFRLAQRRNLFIIRNDLLQCLNNRQITGLETYKMGGNVFIV